MTGYLELVNRALNAMGVEAVTTALPSTDRDTSQISALTQDLFDEVLRYRWQENRGEFLLTTVSGQDLYDLPLDWHDLAQEGAWNVTERTPLAPALSVSDRAFQQNALIGGLSSYPSYSVIGKKIEMKPVPTSSGAEFSFPYYSKNLAVSASGLDKKRYFTFNDDMFLLDDAIFTSGFKYLYRREKRLNYQPDEADFRGLCDRLSARDKPARLNLNGTGGYRLRQYNPNDYPILG